MDDNSTPTGPEADASNGNGLKNGVDSVDATPLGHFRRPSQSSNTIANHNNNSTVYASSNASQATSAYATMYAFNLCIKYVV